MSDALDAFMATAERIVYCSLATVDGRGRPRSRLVHAVWERVDGADGLVGWVGSRPTPFRRAHLEPNPFVSCFYWDPAHDVAVAECRVTWIEDDESRRDAWERLSAPPAPMGYDPAPIWTDGPTGDDFVALRLNPWRVQAKAPWRWQPASPTWCGLPKGSDPLSRPHSRGQTPLEGWLRVSGSSPRARPPSGAARTRARRSGPRRSTSGR